MQCDYRIDDILRQTEEFLVYQATGSDGGAYTLTRLKYPVEILDNLRDGRFEKALSQLKRIQHSCLRPIVDGGLDPIDHQPWIATRAWEGDALSQRIHDGVITFEDRERIEGHGKSLIAEVLDQAGALDFRDTEIVLSTASNGEQIVTFGFDYLVWFRDLAMGYQPGYQNDAKARLQDLLASLPPVGMKPVAMAVSQPPKEKTSLGASPPQVLASAQGGSGAKNLGAIIAVLTALLAGAIWWLTQIKTEKEDALSETQEDVPEILAKEEVDLPVSKTEDAPQAQVEAQAQVELEVENTIEAPVVKVIEAAPADILPDMPSRPALGFIKEVDLADEKLLNEKIGSWIILKGKVDGTKGGQVLFQGSDMRAELKEGNAPAVDGQMVTIVGYLESRSILRVERGDDVTRFDEVGDLPTKDIYTLADEAQIRTLLGLEVTLKATVRAVKTSNSGATIYLVFNESKPEFAASIRTRYAEEGFDLTFMKTLQDQTITVTGKVTQEKGWGGKEGRLLVVFKDKSQLVFEE